jgi:hypothetical protein
LYFLRCPHFTFSGKTPYQRGEARRRDGDVEYLPQAGTTVIAVVASDGLFFGSIQGLTLHEAERSLANRQPERLDTGGPAHDFRPLRQSPFGFFGTPHSHEQFLLFGRHDKTRSAAVPHWWFDHATFSNSPAELATF